MKRFALSVLALALAATGVQAQTGLTASDQYFLYFNAQARDRQLQRMQQDQQKSLASLRAARAQLAAPRAFTGSSRDPLLEALEGTPRGRSPQLSARPLPAHFGGPGATRQYFQRNSYFNPR